MTTAATQRVLAAVAWVQHNPVIPLDIVKFLLAGGVVLGWWAAPAQPITDLGSASAAVAFAALTWATHSAVKPPAPPVP